jgi:phosphoglycolate phosphatase-like HAD superfamily hydrolase
MKQPLPKVCAFDFDGTLVDTMWGYADIAAEAMKKQHGIPFEEGRRLYLDTSGIPFFQQLEIIRPGSDRNTECAEEFERRKIEGLFRSPPDADTLNGLNKLRSAGVKVAISSNNFQHLVEEYLQRYPGLTANLALGFDGLGLEKGRTHFIEIERRLGIETPEVLYCGDSLKDGERAMDYGVQFVGKVGIFSHEQFVSRFPGIKTVQTISEFADRVIAGNLP